MTNLILIPVIIAIGVNVVGCNKSQPVRTSSGFEEGSIYKSDKDAPIPRGLVSVLEKDYIQVFREEKPDSALTDLQLSLQVPRRLLQISVFLKEKSIGTMVKNAKFHLPQGGGTIDLAEIVNQGKGIFHLDFDFTGLKEEQVEKIRVFFVSNSKRFDVHGKTFGAGCGKYFEVTKYFHNVIRSKGMELAAADYRYLGQILGSFFFSFSEPDALFVGSASFVDSRYQDSHCHFPEN